jgi:hypothetical protein
MIRVLDVKPRILQLLRNPRYQFNEKALKRNFGIGIGGRVENGEGFDGGVRRKNQKLLAIA